MATPGRWLAGFGLAAALAGIGSWMLVRYIVGPTPTGNTNPGVTASAAAPGERRIKVTLFYVAEDGLRLAPVERDVPFAEGPGEQARRIIEAQLMPPPSPLLAAIPNGTTLRGIYVADKGEAYVDFGGAVRSAHPGGSLHELFTVYSIVSVLTVNLPAITWSRSWSTATKSTRWRGTSICGGRCRDRLYGSNRRPSPRRGDRGITRIPGKGQP